MIYNDLEKIIKHYGIRVQIIKFSEATLELQDAVIDMETAHHDEHIDNIDLIAEELADVMVLWEQIRLYYGIPSQTIQGIMKEKINRQLKRMEEQK